MQDVVRVAHGLAGIGVKLDTRVSGSDLAGTALGSVVRVKDLGVDRNASHHLVLASMHEHQVESSAATQRRMSEQFTGSLVRNGIGECADRVDGIVNRALTILDHILYVRIQATVFFNRNSRVVGKEDDLALILVRRRIAAVAQPHDIPVLTIRRVVSLFRFCQFPDRLGDSRCLLAHVDVPVHVVFEDEGRAPVVLYDEFQEVEVAEPGHCCAVRFYGSEFFEGFDEGFAPFWLLGDGHGNACCGAGGVEAINSPFGSLG